MLSPAILDAIRRCDVATDHVRAHTHRIIATVVVVVCHTTTTTTTLVCTATTLGALVQRVRAHLRLPLMVRQGRGGGRHHSITVWPQDQSHGRLDSAALSALLRSRRAAGAAFTQVEARVVVGHDGEAAVALAR
jgi:hypothetical protein